MAAKLALRYNLLYAPEFARYYLNKNGLAYKQQDLIKIAKGQQQSIDYLKFNQDLVIADTDLLTIKIWSEYKYGNCDQLIIDMLEEKLADLYLLCSPTIPWTFDALRENPTDRKELHEIYIKELVKLKVPFVTITGNESKRLKTALRAIEKLKIQL